MHSPTVQFPASGPWRLGDASDVDAKIVTIATKNVALTQRNVITNINVQQTKVFCSTFQTEEV